MSLSRLLIPILPVLLASPFFMSSTLAQVDHQDPAAAREFIKLGNEAWSNAEYQKAIQYYERVDSASGDLYARAVFNIGVCRYELFQTDEAIAKYRLAIKLSRKGYPNASYALGVAFEELKQREAAKEAYRQAIKDSGGKHAPAYFRLGVMTGEEDPEAAATLFRAAITHSGDTFPNGHNNLGVMLARSGKFLEAKREFELALKQGGASLPEAKYNLELCESLIKNQANAQLIGQLILK